MPTNYLNLKQRITDEFSSQLGNKGFRLIAPCRWIRPHNDSIKQIFVLNAIKGGQYSPAWGFSTGIAPSFKGQVFRKQSSDKNSVMELIIDPIDVTGVVPEFAFSVLGDEVFDIHNRAAESVKLAASDFARVDSLGGFCSFFLERRQLQYRRFGFDMYTMQRLAHGFVLILTGKQEDGIKRIQNFCEAFEADFSNSVLQACIQKAKSTLFRNSDR